MIWAPGDNMGAGEEGAPERERDNDKEESVRVGWEGRADDKAIVKKGDAIQADLDAISRGKRREVELGKGAAAGDAFKDAVKDEHGLRILTVGGKPRKRRRSKGDRGAGGGAGRW
jgi:hypothetical protein